MSSRLVVGVIGHVDHGKTALVGALTGQETDRLPEEKARGISIALGFAHLELAGSDSIDLIDMPGHERFVRTMISGATGIDAVLLVVAANEGISAQTVEHADIASLLGISLAVVAVTKCDLVDDKTARAVAADAVALLTDRGMEVLPAGDAVCVSSQTGLGLESLRAALAKLCECHRPRTADGMAFLPVDRAFSIPGHGPVVTGTLRGGLVTAGDTLELWPDARSVRVRAVQVHGLRMDQAFPGQRVALNLRGVDLADLARGMVLALPGSIAPASWFTLKITAVADAPAMKNGMQVRALFGTNEVDARLRLLDGDVLEPGASSFVQLHLSAPAYLPVGEPVVLRHASPARTLAGGRLLDPVSRRLRRHSEPVLERLRNLADVPVAQLLAYEVGLTASSGTTVTHLSALTGLGVARVVELLGEQPVIVTRSGAVLAKAEVDRILLRIPVLLGLHRDGVPIGRLRTLLPGIGPAILDEAIGRLMASGRIVKRGAVYVLPRPDEDRRRLDGEQETARQLEAILKAAGLSPPTPKELLTDHRKKAAMDRLLRDGLVVRATDRAKNKEILFHSEAIVEARRVLAPLLAQGEGLLVSDIAQALGISRKYTMPLLDHLDSTRFTKRVGDLRVKHS